MGKGLHTPWKLIDRIFHSSDSLKLLAAKQGLHGLSLTKCEIFKSAYVKFNSSDASSELKELQGSRIPLSLSTLTGQPTSTVPRSVTCETAKGHQKASLRHTREMEPLGEVSSVVVVRKHTACLTCAMQLFVTGPSSKVKNCRIGDIWNVANIRFLNHSVYRTQLVHNTG